jgi:integrase
VPRQPAGRTVFLFPEQAEQLLVAAAPHLKPLLVFLIGTGCRLGEAIYLQWQDVDLTGARVILWPDQTKSRRRRVVELPPRVVAALAALPHRHGAVFRQRRGKPYLPREQGNGGQLASAWKSAIRRARLEGRGFTPHACRHTWASWHYAVHKDLLALKVEGGWGSVALVERYAHLLPVGHEEEIRRSWGL